MGLRADMRGVPRAPSLTAEEYAQVFKMAAEGLSQCEIGRRLGRNNATICKILNGKIKCRLRAVRGPSPTELRLARIELVRSLLAANPGVTNRELVAVVGVDRRSVLRYKKLIRGGDVLIQE